MLSLGLGAKAGLPHSVWLLVGGVTSQQHASVSQGRICLTSQQHASVSQGRICLTSQQHASVSQGRICLTSQQHASVSQGRICSDNFTCCHTKIEVADQTFYLTQSQYTYTGATSPSADPITPGVWQGSHWSANFLSHWYDSTPEKSRRKRDSNPGSPAPEADALTTRPTRRSLSQCVVGLTTTPAKGGVVSGIHVEPTVIC